MVAEPVIVVSESLVTEQVNNKLTVLEYLCFRIGLRFAVKPSTTQAGRSLCFSEEAPR